MKVVIAYENRGKLNEEDQKIIDFYRVCGSHEDEIELDTFSDVYELAQELGRVLCVGSFVILENKEIPSITIVYEEEAE